MSDSKIVLVIKNVDLKLAKKIQKVINEYDSSKKKGDKRK